VLDVEAGLRLRCAARPSDPGRVVSHLEPDSLAGWRSAWLASPPMGDGAHDQESSTAFLSVGRCCRRGREFTGRCVAHLDPDQVAVVVYQQMDGSLAVNDGVGHQLAGEKHDGVEQLRRPAVRDRPETAAGESRRRNGVRKHLRLGPVHDSSSARQEDRSDYVYPLAPIRPALPLSLAGDDGVRLHVKDIEEIGDLQHPAKAWTYAVRAEPTTVARELRPYFQQYGEPGCVYEDQVGDPMRMCRAKRSTLLASRSRTVGRYPKARSHTQPRYGPIPMPPRFGRRGTEIRTR
jgi:hypothetical protein